MPPGPGSDGVLHYRVRFLLAALSFIGVLRIDLRFLFLQGRERGDHCKVQRTMFQFSAERWSLGQTGNVNNLLVAIFSNFVSFRNLAIPLAPWENTTNRHGSIFRSSRKERSCCTPNILVVHFLQDFGLITLHGKKSKGLT